MGIVFNFTGQNTSEEYNGLSVLVEVLLGAFATFRKETVSFVVSVSPSVRME